MFNQSITERLLKHYYPSTHMSKVKRVNLDVELGLYKQFKKKCIDEDVTMSDVLRFLMERWLTVS